METTVHIEIDPVALIASMGRHARSAALVLAGLSSADKARALEAMARAIRDAEPDILAANKIDMANGTAAGLSAALLDRLKLTPERVAATADGVATVATLKDPVGEVIDEIERPNGLKLARVRVPIGVIGIIYESRPNVTADAAALCIGSGNAVILRGGSEAIESNRAIHAALVQGLEAAGLPGEAVQLVPVTDRAAVGAMLAGEGVIDMIVPRGGKGLVARVQAEARVPVLAHLDGINHIYVHASADQAMAEDIVVNAKMRRTGVCGAMETLLIDRDYPHAGQLIQKLQAAGCEVRGDPLLKQLVPGVVSAGSEDWDTEYLDAIASARLVNGIDEALNFIAAHGSHHTDAIVTEDDHAAEKFLNEVDSAIVLHNASTQFADGGEFGFGAEIGIATGKFHARGPVGAEQLTSFKYRVHGTGQTRP